MSCSFVFDQPIDPPNRRRGYSEAMSAWIAESGDETAVHARRWINEMYRWFDDPNHALRNNLTSGDDSNFYGAVTSLAVHDRLRRMGLDLQCDEATSGDARRPDLIVKPGTADETLLECTAVLDDEETSSRNRQLDTLMDELDRRLGGSPWFIVVRPLGAFIQNPPPSRIAAAIAQDIAGLSLDLAVHTRTYPQWSLKVDFLRSERGRSLIRPVGGSVPFEHARVMNDEQRIVRKLDSKSPAYYAAASRPFVLAINPAYTFFDEEEIVDLLYDRRTGYYGRFGSGRHVDHSGVLLVTGLRAMGTSSMTLALMPNPNAVAPASAHLVGANRVFDVDTLSWRDVEL